jgi:diguanylate cyclase (GGDEF)-like protein/PAS domain S-box-containing protein
MSQPAAMADDAEFEARMRLEMQRRMARTPAMLHSIDADGRLISVSDAWLAKLGYIRDDVIGRRSSEFLTPASREHAVKNVLPEFFRTGRCDNVQYQMVCKDGSVIDVLLSAVLDDAHTSLAVITDITAMNETRRSLAESEARYRLLAENATDLIILVDHQGKRSYASPACFRLLGYTPEEMLSINSADAVHPDDIRQVMQMLADGTAELGTTEHPPTYRMRRKDGSYVWVEASGRAVDVAGQEHQRLLILRGVEQRMESERHLKESEARYRLLADNSTDMVFRLDSNLVRSYVSPACREILGYEPDEMLGTKPVEMAHPDDAPRVALVFQTLLSGKTDRHSIINRIRHRDGRWIWVEAQLRALKDPASGRTISIIGGLRDISARKAIEDELAEANRRLQTLAGQDSLTGLANRRAFDEALVKEHLRSRREKAKLGLIMIDVDRFKQYNDIYGHLAGDDCLRCVGAAISDAISRPGDIAFRYGGEEFAILLPGTDEAGAAIVAQRVGEIIFSLGLRHEGNPDGVVTISAGVASYPCGDISSDGLILAADQALYRAKERGRNCVVGSGEMAVAGQSAAVA